MLGLVLLKHDPNAPIDILYVQYMHVHSHSDKVFIEKKNTSIN